MRHFSLLLVALAALATVEAQRRPREYGPVNPLSLDPQGQAFPGRAVPGRTPPTGQFDSRRPRTDYARGRPLGPVSAIVNDIRSAFRPDRAEPRRGGFRGEPAPLSASARGPLATPAVAPPVGPATRGRGFGRGGGRGFRRGGGRRGDLGPAPGQF